MKRKVYYVIGAVVIVLAIVAASAFLFFTKDVEPAATDFNLDGTWRLFNCTTISADAQYLIFSDGIVEIYSGDETVTRKFEYSSGGLKLIDIGFDSKVEKLTDNYLVLYDSNRTEYTLVRSNEDRNAMQDVDWNSLVGTWDVIIHGKGFLENEQMVFDETSMKVYRDGSATPYLNSTYTIKEKGMLVVDSIGLELNLCYLDSDLAILVETQTGYAYELARHK